MKKNLALYTASLMFAFGNSFPREAVSQERWWQREQTPQSSIQAVNPEYLKKKRELEQMYDQTKQVEEFQKKEGTSIGWKYGIHLNERLDQLEHELSQIPMYLPSQGPSRDETPPQTINRQTERNNFPSVEYRANQPQMISEGKLKIVYHYITQSTIQVPDRIIKAGGIEFYGWTLYPEVYIKKRVDERIRSNEQTKKMGLDPSKVHDIETVIRGYELTGEPEKDKVKIDETLKLGEPIHLMTRQPATANITIPSGKYYLDYWIITPNEIFYPSFGSSPVAMSRIAGPMSINTKDKTDWGPLELIVKPDFELEINVQPYSDNATGRGKVGPYYGWLGVLDILNYNFRPTN